MHDIYNIEYIHICIHIVYSVINDNKCSHFSIMRNLRVAVRSSSIKIPINTKWVSVIRGLS